MMHQESIGIPSFGNGMHAALAEMVTGLISAVLVSAMANAVGMPWVSALFTVVSIVAVIGLFDHATYWSITYTFGYLVSIILIGQYILELWEIVLYMAVTIVSLYFKLGNADWW